MKKIGILIVLICALFSNCEEEITVDTDYSPATIAYTQLRQINDKQLMFKERVKKNVSIEYENCINLIKNLRCNNVDQWQSVVEELKLENMNSNSVEVPFLKKRKAEKVDQLKKLLESTSKENKVLGEMVSKIQANQKKLMEYQYYLDEMYKLPKVQSESEFAQLRSGDPTEKENVAEELNSDVPDLAKEQLGEAKDAYDLADQTIQAQTASNLLKDYVKKISQTLNDLQKSFDSRFEDLLDKKGVVKSDILKARAMLKNEEDIKTRNMAKIGEIEERIAACKGKPTNIEKDCEPIRVNASKILTELEIVETRQTLLYSYLSSFLEQNSNSANLAAHSQELSNAANAAQQQTERDSYLYETQTPPAPRDIQELHPVHHFKDTKKKPPAF